MSDSGPSPKEVVDYYNSRVDYQAPRKARHERIFQTLDRIIQPNRSVLDLGCGVGHTSIYMARQGCDVLGVDHADKLIEYAKTHNSNKNVTYMVGDITQIQLSKRFDIITLCDVIEHLQPDTMLPLMGVVNTLAHQRTLLYVNIPIAAFTLFGRDKFEHQIIETEVEIGGLLAMLDLAGFIPTSVESAGEGCPFEYYEIICVTKEHANDLWTDVYTTTEPASPDGDVPENGTRDGEEQK